MSRVFEALTKGSEEKQRQAQRPAEKIESAEEPVDEKKASSEQHFRTNGTVSSVNTPVGETHVKFFWDELRPLLGTIAAFSFFINLLFLVPAIFMLQVFDRVLSSNSQETLLVLLAGTGVALLILLLLDYVRNRLQNVLGNIVDERLSPPVVNAIVAKAARAPHRREHGGYPRRRGPAQRVCRQWLDRGVRRALGRGVRAGDLGVPPRLGSWRRAVPPSSC